MTVRAEQGGSSVLHGTAGLGKSRVLQAVRDTYAGPTIALTATSSTSQVPLGVLLPMIEGFGDAALAGGPEALGEMSIAEVRRMVAQALREMANGDQLLITIDDAHLLDPTTARGLEEAVTLADWCSVLFAVRTDEPCPPGIAAAWTSPACLSVALERLDETSTHDLASAVLGGPIDAGLAADVTARSAGLPFAVVELLRGALEVDAVKLDGDVWRAVAALPTHRLGGLVDRRLSQVSSQVRYQAALIALAEPVPQRVVGEVASAPAVGELEQLGVVEWVPAGSSQRLVVSHPLYADVLRGGLSHDERETGLRLLADAFDHVDATRNAPLLVALWRLEAGGGDAQTFELAARRAYGIGDYRLTVRFARAALEQGGGYHSRLALGAALVELGEAEEGLQWIGDARTYASDELEDAWSTIALCHARWVAAGQPDVALGELKRFTERATGSPVVNEVEGYAAVVAAVIGDLVRARRSLDTLVDVTDEPNDRTRLLAAVAAALLREERPADQVLDRLVERGAEPSAEALRALPLGATLLSLAELPREQDLDVSLLSARRGLQVSLRSGETDQRAWWLAAVGRLEMEAGEIDRARGRFRSALIVLEEVDTLRWAPVVRCLLARASAATGEITAARTLVESVTGERGRSPRVDVLCAIAEAEVAALENRGDVATEAALRAGELAGSRGMATTAIEAVKIALRSGEGSAAARSVSELITWRDHPQGPLVMAACEAQSDHDAVGLEAAARAFAAVGRRLFAAQLAALASEMAAWANDPATADRADALAAGLRASCGGAAETRLDGARRAPLAPRARLIARRVIDGSSSRELAEALDLSSRTVDNQLGRVYRSLGVRSRSELAACYRSNLAPLADAG